MSLTEEWDELDFELLGNNPQQVWINEFHDGTDPKAPMEDKFFDLPNNKSISDSAYYCII